MNLIQSIYAMLSTIAKRLIVWWNAEYDKRTGRSKWIFLAVSCLFACCICSVPMSLILPDPTPTRIVNEVAEAEAAEPTPEEETPFPTAESRASGIEVEATSTLVDTAAPIIVAAATAADPTNTPRSIRAATSDQAASATPAPTQPPPTKLSTPSPTVAPTIAPTSPPLPTATAIPPTVAVPTAAPTVPPPTVPPATATSEPTVVPPTASPPEPTQPTEPTAPPPAAPGAVVISGINYDGAVPDVESDEYAVITNTGGTAVNLGGWRLNAGNPGQDFIFPSFDLQPGQSCRVYTNQVHPEYCGFSFGRGDAIWRNSGDCGYLYDNNGTLVSQRCY